MDRLKSAVLVATVIAATPVGAALAADYFPSPIAVGGNWYLRGHIGMAAQGLDGLDHPSFDTPVFFEWLNEGDFDAVPIFGLGVGKQVTDRVRIDLTAEYRGKAGFTALDRYDEDDDPPDFGGGAGGWGTNHYTGEKSELLFLANGYVDLATMGSMTPYLGAGVGVSYNTISGFVDNNEVNGGQGWAPPGHKWNFAWALHAGLGIKATQNLTVDLQYSFVSLGDAQTGPFENSDPIAFPCVGVCEPMLFDNLYSHDLKLGVRWLLDGVY